MPLRIYLPRAMEGLAIRYLSGICSDECQIVAVRLRNGESGVRCTLPADATNRQKQLFARAKSILLEIMRTQRAQKRAISKPCRNLSKRDIDAPRILRECRPRFSQRAELRKRVREILNKPTAQEVTHMRKPRFKPPVRSIGYESMLEARVREKCYLARPADAGCVLMPRNR